MQRTRVGCEAFIPVFENACRHFVFIIIFTYTKEETTRFKQPDTSSQETIRGKDTGNCSF